MSGAVLAAEGIERSYGAARVLRGVSLALAAGEWVALVGPSGCGKTTLLQTLGLLDRPDAGRVLVEGVDAWARSDGDRTLLRRTRLGFVFQRHNLLEHLTGLENVMLPAWRATGDRAVASREAARLLERLGLASRAHLRSALLSTGEAQRVAIARALINRPGVVLADEPTGSLDSASAANVLDALSALREAGVGLLVATHDPNVAARADRRIAMLDGSVV